MMVMRAAGILKMMSAAGIATLVCAGSLALPAQSPDWLSKIPEDSSCACHYFSGYGTGKTKEAAVNAATNNAKEAVAEFVLTKISSKFNDEVQEVFGTASENIRSDLHATSVVPVLSGLERVALWEEPSGSGMAAAALVKISDADLERAKDAALEMEREIKLARAVVGRACDKVEKLLRSSPFDNEEYIKANALIEGIDPQLADLPKDCDEYSRGLFLKGRLGLWAARQKIQADMAGKYERCAIVECVPEDGSEGGQESDELLGQVEAMFSGPGPRMRFFSRKALIGRLHETHTALAEITHGRVVPQLGYDSFLLVRYSDFGDQFKLDLAVEDSKSRALVSATTATLTKEGQGSRGGIK